MSAGALRGKVAVVTGGGRGMGRAIARAFAAEGADVAVLDRSPDNLGDVRADIEGHGRRALAVEADITEVAALPAVFDSIAAELGGIDILMNNAGVSPEGPAVDVTEADWDLAMDVNVKGLFFCAQQAARHFVAAGKGGKIVNTSSAYGLTVEAGLGIYCVSKGAVLQLTRALAAEWAPHGINVNAIGPTLVGTDMTSEMFADEAYMAEFMKKIPYGKLPQPSDIADAVLFLAGPRSDYVHGHMIAVDSGELVI
jgi:NAD(P)-dependent dehydrogenase (short-subunit alcohol dehydrogenase family)